LKIESSFQNQNKQKRLMSKLSCSARQRIVYDRGERSDTSMRVRFTRDLLQFSLHSMAASAQRSHPNANCRGREARQPRFDWVLPYVWQRGYHFHLARSPRRR
jgi:hypothetical protein